MKCPEKKIEIIQTIKGNAIGSGDIIRKEIIFGACEEGKCMAYSKYRNMCKIIENTKLKGE